MRRGISAVLFQTGFIYNLETPRIATSCAFIIGVKAVPPISPKLEMVKLHPCISPGESFPSLARVLISIRFLAISTIPIRSTPLITGTTKPLGVSTATPILKYFCTSSLRMRPFAPDPLTCSRSTPSLRANLRT